MGNTWEYKKSSKIADWWWPSRCSWRTTAFFMESGNAPKIATIGSCFAGVLCATGWYTFVGALLANGKAPGDFWAPGILGSVGLVLLNLISWEAVTDDGGLGGDGVSMKAKAWVTLCFIILFCSLFASAWICISNIQEDKHRTAAILVVVQTVCIFVAALVFR